MIRIPLACLAFFLSAQMARSQDAKSFVLNLYGGYVSKDKPEFTSYKGEVRSGFQYGAGIEYYVQSNASFELKYQRMDTRTPLFLNAGGVQVNPGADKAALQFILIGAYTYFTIPETIFYPYIGTDLGIGMLKNESSQNRTGFAWNIKIGTKIQTGSVLSFKIQAYAQSLSGVLGDKYYTDAAGNPISVGKKVSLLQFGVSGIAGINLTGKRRR